MVVVLEMKIYVYNFQNLKLIEVIETCQNLKGVCAVSPSKDVCVLAAPDKKLGSIRIVHFDKGSKTLQIDAHQTAISAIALNTEGTLLASSSDKGTLVRLWDTENGAQLQELRRGTDPAGVYCISFDPSSKYISCSSDKGTIHIFAVRNDLSLAASLNKQADDMNGGNSQSEDRPLASEPTTVSNTKSIFSYFSGVLPKYFDSEWSFA